MIGGEQVTIRKMEGSPSRIIRNALREEYENNWKDAYMEVSDNELPRGANVIARSL